MEANPLRVLDSQREADAPLIAAAPRMLDHLSADAAAHFAGVKRHWTPLMCLHHLAPSSPRALYYYVRTTFEFAAEALDAAQKAVGGGGRYDGLAAELGAPETPGVGFALGVDRTLLACDAEGVFDVRQRPLTCLWWTSLAGRSRSFDPPDPCRRPAGRSGLGRPGR
ncbi:MAG: hypothetical protein Ct9H300mP12_08970 [Acidimicrobiales bacterium]|nr:MAG: hypothetical protein Ct9H300mP12_08970 [Acidimicrobiales bacterium]